VVLHGALVDTEKMKKKTHTFFSFCFQVLWVQFLTVVASIDLPGAVRVICSAREHVWGCFLVTWRGVRNYLEHVCALWGGSSLKKSLYPVDIG
jgi:hypothetical protein